MFSLKKEFIGKQVASNTVILSAPFYLSTKSYSPIQIKVFPPILKSKPEVFRCFSTVKLSKAKDRTRLKKPLNLNSSLALPMKAKAKVSIMQTILDFKLKVASKYTKNFLLISYSVTKPIEFEDILNYLKLKHPTKDLKSLFGQPESLNSLMSQLSKTIMKAFDINLRFSISLDEFLGACSVHEVFFPNTAFNLLNTCWLGKLKDRIDELRANFKSHVSEGLNKTDHLLGTVKKFENTKDRMGFVGFIKSSNLNFTLYLQILPVFMNLENSFI